MNGKKLILQVAKKQLWAKFRSMYNV